MADELIRAEELEACQSPQLLAKSGRKGKKARQKERKLVSRCSEAVQHGHPATCLPALQLQYVCLQHDSCPLAVQLMFIRLQAVTFVTPCRRLRLLSSRRHASQKTASQKPVDPSSRALLRHAPQQPHAQPGRCSGLQHCQQEAQGHCLLLCSKALCINARPAVRSREHRLHTTIWRVLLQLAVSAQPIILLANRHLCCRFLVVANVLCAGKQMLISYSSLVGMPVLAPAVLTSSSLALLCAPCAVRQLTVALLLVADRLEY